jgi:hypothetical protein
VANKISSRFTAIGFPTMVIWNLRLIQAIPREAELL